MHRDRGEARKGVTLSGGAEEVEGKGKSHPLHCQRELTYGEAWPSRGKGRVCLGLTSRSPLGRRCTESTSSTSLLPGGSMLHGERGGALGRSQG